MRILKSWIIGFLSLFVFLRDKDIWGVWNRVQKSGNHKSLSAHVFQHYLDRKGGYIGFGAKLKGIPYFPHGLYGVFISNDCEIGKNAVIFQQVTIGSVRTAGSKRVGSPVIGDDCYIGAGAKIIGNVKIGNHCRIGAKAVVYEDMPDHSVATCAATRIRVLDEVPDNRFFRLRADGREEVWQDGHFQPVEES